MLKRITIALFVLSVIALGYIGYLVFTGPQLTGASPYYPDGFERRGQNAIDPRGSRGPSEPDTEDLTSEKKLNVNIPGGTGSGDGSDALPSLPGGGDGKGSLPELDSPEGQDSKLPQVQHGEDSRGSRTGNSGAGGRGSGSGGSGSDGGANRGNSERSEKISESLKAVEVEVETFETDEGTVIVIESLVLFEFGSSELAASSYKTLEELTRTIEPLGAAIKIAGHTDSIGTDEANQKLSNERAAAVRDALRDLGFTHEMKIAGLGSSEPRAANTHSDGSDNPEGRAKNRRVEITLLNN